MKIVFIGDSITDMWRNRDLTGNEPYRLGYGYPYVVASKLSEIDPLKYEVINKGCGGDKITNLLVRIKEDAFNLNPDVLSIFIGVNDVWHEIGHHNGTDLNRFEEYYRNIIEDTKKYLPNCKIMLMEPYLLNGICTKDIYDQMLDVYKYAEVVKNLAREYNLSFVPLQDKLTEMSNKYTVEAYAYDGVHSAVCGATLIANEWLKVFKKIDK